MEVHNSKTEHVVKKNIQKQTLSDQRILQKDMREIVENPFEAKKER